MPIVQSHEIHCREDFALLLNWRKLYEGVAEIGVDRAEFAQCLLSRWYGADYFGIDDYAPYIEMPWDRSGDLGVATLRLERYAARSKIVKATSVEASKMFRKLGRQFDFIYIDGCHEEDFVRQDLESWVDLVRSGGIIAGHDFDEEHSGVMRAVTKFFEKRKSTVYLTHEPRLTSWYVYVDGLPGPDWTRL